MRQRSDVTIAIAPSHVPYDYPWVNAFGRAVAQGGFKIIDYRYEFQFPQSANVLIMHWPDMFFTEQNEQRLNKLNELLNAWLLAKASRGLRLVWVMHNVRPHDTFPGNSNLTKRFLESLDGIIYLSKHSRELFIDIYGTNVRHELICKRGHDRDGMLSPHRPPPPICEGVKLCCFGRIRPYKGLEDLIECSDELETSRGSLTIAGCGDSAYSAKIEAMAAGRFTIRLDLRNELLPLSELEAVTDRSHGVVLPYRNILNSGAVFFALSRNRPVLCPRMGSLPEVQADVGPEWLHLYQGALEPSVLRSFVAYLRVTQPSTCDLSAHDWAPIARSIGQFLDQMCIAGG